MGKRKTKVRVRRIPKSLGQAIDEDPDRFMSYLDLKKIAKSKNPYVEMKKEMRKKFGSTTTGLNLWKYLKGSYKLQNKLYKAKKLQKMLPKQFKGSYKRNIFQQTLHKFIHKPTKTPTKVVGIKKTVEVSKGYTRIVRGREVTIRTHARSRPKLFGGDELDFLTRRIGQSPGEVTQIFNTTFKKPRSYHSIRTKLLRLKAK